MKITKTDYHLRVEGLMLDVWPDTWKLCLKGGKS